MRTRKLLTPTYATMPCTEVIAIAGIVLHSDVPLAIHLLSIYSIDCVIDTHPLSAVMKTRAMSLPAAAFAAPVKSVSLRDEVTVVPSCFALVVMASTGYILTISGALDGGKKRRPTAIKYGKSAVPLPQPIPRTPLSPPRSVKLWTKSMSHLN